MRKAITIWIILAGLAGAFLLFMKNNTVQNNPESKAVSTTAKKVNIEDKSRVTKKLFGTHVSPGNSPVGHEKFTGYHTGVDFETTPAEANVVVPVPAICDGKLLVKESATGYGGVAVQACNISNQAVTVIYGHLKPSSITIEVGQILNKNETIGILGKGNSAETSGERKHLHLSIHKGSALNIRGYVSSRAELAGWLDPLLYLK